MMMMMMMMMMIMMMHFWYVDMDGVEFDAVNKIIDDIEDDECISLCVIYLDTWIAHAMMIDEGFLYLRCQDIMYVDLQWTEKQ